MKNVIENLERYYQSFINQEREWDFFLGLADYVKYVLETPETNEILEFVLQKRVDAEKDVKKYEIRVIKEIKQAKEKLFKIIKDKKISYKGLDEEIKEYLEYESGHIQSSQSEAENLNDALQDIIRNLFKSGFKDLVKDFAVEYKGIPNEVGKYTFSKTIDLLFSEKERFDEAMSRELWGDWNYLLLAYLVIFKKEKELARLNKDKKNFYFAWNFVGLVNEMKGIREGRLKETAGTISNSNPVFFVKDKYKHYALRIHNHLIKELSLEMARRKENNRPVKIFRNRAIPDRTAEMEKLMREEQIRQSERTERERLHKEQMKQDRILRTSIDKYAHALNLIIERAEYAEDDNNFSINFYDFNFEQMIGSRMLEKFLTELQNNDCFEKYERTNYAGGTRFGFMKPNIKNLKKFKEKRKTQKPTIAIPKDKSKAITKFEITIKDREIWINYYLLSKPHAVGANYEFLERIQAKEPNTEIKRNEFPQLFQEEIKNKTFFQILNALGFKGEIKKAFFYKVSKNSLFFRGNKITKKDLEKAGVNIKILIKELELAHTRNYPE